MPQGEVDLAYALPSERITIELWSSDYTSFQIENKVIRTTIKNNILDLKEVISERSMKICGRLNPQALKIIYKNIEYSDYEELSNIVDQDRENIRLRVEMNPDKFGIKDVRPALMNIILILSNGKRILLRESLQATIKSIKYSLVEDLNLDAIDNIITLQYNAGEELENKDDVTMSELLQLDTVPSHDLHIYVRLKDDFVIRLSSPNETILRTNRMIASLETSISTIKQFILDQYTGQNDLDQSLVKIIYSGRVLGSDQKLSGIINGDSAANSLVTLHFAINEPDNPRQNPTNDQATGLGALWSDLRRGGSLFEFLPVEPNPNFEADLERDRRLREQLAGNITHTEGPTNVDSSESHTQLPGVVPIPEENEYVETITEFENSVPELPDNIKLLGETFESAIVDGEEVLINQKELSTFIFEVTLNSADGPKVVKLSNSQVIINNSDPLNPYLMISPSGFAALSTLGIDIQPPDVIISDEGQPMPTPTFPLTDATSTASMHQTATTQPIQLNPQPQVQHQHQHQQDGFMGMRRLSIRINAISFTRAFSVCGRLAYHFLKIWLFYTLIITQIPNVFHRKLCLGFLVFYIITNQSIRNLLHEWQLLMPEQYRNWTVRYIQEPERQLRNGINHSSRFLIGGILDCLPTSFNIRDGQGSFIEKIDEFARYFIVSVILFFTSIFPSLHRDFLQERQTRLITREREMNEIRERILREQHDEQHRAGGAESGDVTTNTTITDTNTDTTNENNDTNNSINDSINTTEEIIQPQDSATGTQRHHEN